MRDAALLTLRRIRRNSLDDAERAVAEALREQQRVQTHCANEEARYAGETLAALDLAAGEKAIDAFARWHPAGRAAIESAQIAKRDASETADRARILLGSSRAAHRCVDTLLEQRAEQARLAGDRRAQYEMDDLAARRFPRDQLGQRRRT